MKNTLLGLVVATAASTAMAQQQPYATIKSVEGLVTVTSNNQLTNAASNMQLPQGAQVLSTTTGKATIQFASGCSVTIQGGQSLDIQETACTAFLASNPGAAGAGAGGVSGTTKLLAGAVGLGLLYNQTRGSNNTTPTVVLPAPAPSPTPAAVAPAPVPISGS